MSEFRWEQQPGCILEDTVAEPPSKVTREIALQDARIELEAYLHDQCPEGVEWEQFDPEVDAIRTQIQRAQGEDV